MKTPWEATQPARDGGDSPLIRRDPVNLGEVEGEIHPVSSLWDPVINIKSSRRGKEAMKLKISGPAVGYSKECSEGGRKSV